jgi:signal transduction histidine kinase/response regulator of citrate/malate metabolism
MNMLATADDGVEHCARVLIVDDQPSGRKLLAAMLAPEGLEVQTAASGKEALAMVADQPPDLILLDFLMPDMDGCQVTGTIKSRPATRSIPIIMVTSSDDQHARIRGLRAGAEEFLTRPLDRLELCTRVRNLLRLKTYGKDWSERAPAPGGADESARLILARTLQRRTRELREIEVRIAYAFRVARMGVWEFDLPTKRLAWSEALPALFNVAEHEVPASLEGLLSMVHPDDRHLVEDALALVGREGTGFEFEFRALWPDGSAHWMASQARVLCDESDRPTRLLGLTMDVGARKSLEVQFRQSQKMEAVGHLAGGVAHDFNNLVTIILGYTGLVVQSMTSDDPRRADLNEVTNAGQRAAVLARQLLAFSRTQTPQPTTIDLNAVVGGVHKMLGRLLAEDITLTLALARNVGAVRADRGQIEQVLMNLMLNARDAMPLGGRLVVETANADIETSIPQDSTIPAGSYVLLSVRDSGIGMNEETKARVFEPFFSTKAEGRGTGLGLSTALGIVRQSGGYLRVTSELGQGSTFSVYLPRISADRTPEPVVADGPALAVGTETLLIVEDDEAVRGLMRTTLERAGYNILEAASGRRAEALFEKRGGLVDLLVTDVVLPGASGPTLFRRLTQTRPGLRVLYVSGHADDAVVAHDHVDPDVELLHKPFTADALARKVRDVLDRV